jgi:hypothetical protein
MKARILNLATALAIGLAVLQATTGAIVRENELAQPVCRYDANGHLFCVDWIFIS